MANQFRTLTSSVNPQLQQKLYQAALYNGDNPTIGINSKSTALAMSIVRLYFADKQGKFQSMKLGGILCLVVDRQQHSRFLRLYDINSSQLLFQSEMYINFNRYYKELNDYFHCFPIDKCTIGIEFSNVDDASTFKNLVQAYSFKGDNVEEIKEQQLLKIGQQNKEISRPVYFDRKEHAGWDPISQTFILNAVPKEIKLLLKKAGFKKRDLKSKDTALAIYEILLKEIDFDNGVKNVNAARTSSNVDSNYQFKSIGLTERQLSKRFLPGSSLEEGRLESRIAQQQFMTAQRESQELYDSKGKQAVMNSMQNYLRSASIINSAVVYQSPTISPQQLHEESKAKPPVPPPPFPGRIPPPPMAPPMNIPPPIPLNIPMPPKLPSQGQQSVGGVSGNLSFSEQLILQSQNLKKVQENQNNTKVKQLSESQQMKLTMNLAVILEQRKKAMQNENGAHRNSDFDSDDNNEDSDDSVW